MFDSNQIHLVLFFTRGVTLKTWVDSGIFEREVALYRRLQERGMRISFITYGGRYDQSYNHLIPGINILSNPLQLPLPWFERLLPFLHARYLLNCDVIKTNQTNGADVALRAARIWRKPLIVRCGYMWSEFATSDYGSDSAITLQALRIEQEVFSSASHIIVTTQKMADSITDRIANARKKLSIIPNFVDTDIFAPPQVTIASDIDVIFVGRLSPQKNIYGLLEAVKPLPIKLCIIGSGSQSQEAFFQEALQPFNGRVEWLGKNIPNHRLPAYLHRAKVFVLPSHFEGHPKTLIEAMACGLPVIGADSPGIREVITHGETGYLCGTDPESIRAAIQTVLNDAVLRAKLGHRARQFALANYSLVHIVDQEFNVIKELTTRANP